MNEQEKIEYLKKNKEDCVIFMKMPTPVQDWCKSKKGENIFMRLVYEGNEGIWTQTTERINCNCLCIYALPDDYEAPKVEQEILELDVTVSKNIYCNKICLGYHTPNKVKFWDISVPEYEITNNKCVYIFIGYKFEGDFRTYNYYHGWQDSCGVIYGFDAGNNKKVYANKVVYQKVEG